MRTKGAVGLVVLSFFSLAGGWAAVACSSDDPAAASPGGADAGTDTATTPSDPDGSTEEGGATGPGVAKRGTRLAPEYLGTADGLSEFSRIIDTGLDVECWPSRAGDGATRCLPQEAAYPDSLHFADANCQTEVASVNSGCAAPKFAIKLPEGTSCDAGNEVFDVGAQHTGQVYRREGPATCAPIASDPKKAYYVVGAKRPPTDFVKQTAKTEAIAGGVGASMLEGEDGSRMPQFLLVDVARGVACYQGVTVDGKPRCIPSNAGFASPHFTEGTCTKPAVLVSPNLCDDPLYAVKVGVSNDPADDGGVRAYELGAKQPTKETFRKDDQMNCEAGFFGSEDVYERGPEIAATSFPELAIVTTGGTRIVANRWAAAGVNLPPRSGFRDVMLDSRCAFMLSSDGKEHCLPQGTVALYSDDQCTVPVAVTTESPPPKYAIAFGAGCPRTFRIHPLGAVIEPKPAALFDNSSGSCMPSGAGSGPSTAYALGAETPPSTFAEAVRTLK